MIEKGLKHTSELTVTDAVTAIQMGSGDMHLRKIDMADEIFVIRSTSGRLLPTGRKNVGGYIGESTRREIAYAVKTGKKVNYLEPVNP